MSKYLSRLTSETSQESLKSVFHKWPTFAVLLYTKWNNWKDSCLIIFLQWIVNISHEYDLNFNQNCFVRKCWDKQILFLKSTNQIFLHCTWKILKCLVATSNPFGVSLNSFDDQWICLWIFMRNTVV